MSLDVTLPIALRMAGPALFVVLGVAIILLARGRRDRLALGVFLAGFGAAIVLSNLGVAGGGAWFWIGAMVAGLIGTLGGIASMTWPPDSERLHPWALAAPGALAVLYAARAVARVGPTASHNVVFLAAQASGGDAFYLYFALANASISAMILATPLAWALSCLPRKRQTPLGLTSISAGTLILVGFAVGADVLSGYNVTFFLDAPTAFVAVVACAAVWIVVAARHGDRRARNVAWGALAAMLLAMLRHATSGYDSVLDPVAPVGLARLIGWAIVALAVARAGWLDTAWLSRPRTGLAAGALALLFIVAQVAQNFLSAQYGLLMGGVVAGAFLFAASPIQRALEGRSTRSVRVDGRSVEPTDRARREEVYRKALRVALRDRAITRDEETHLHELAEELGIGAGRAHALLVDVEREQRGER